MEIIIGIILTVFGIYIIRYRNKLAPLLEKYYNRWGYGWIYKKTIVLWLAGITSLLLGIYTTISAVIRFG